MFARNAGGHEQGKDAKPLLERGGRSMKYKILLREARSLLTIGELIADKHPELFQALQHHIEPQDITGIILAPAELRGKEIYYAGLMQEKPRPGRGDK